MALNCTLVDIDSMFSTSVQGTYFYQVIFGTRFKFSENQSTLRFHYPYWAPSILLSQGIMYPDLILIYADSLETHYIQILFWFDPDFIWMKYLDKKLHKIWLKSR